jgi:flagellar hook-length control protein FliK
MRLQPEVLGEMTISMDLHPGRVGATFKVATAQARDLLNENLPLLRSALEAKGLDVQRLDVQLVEPAEPDEPQRAAPDKDGQTGGAGTQGRDAHSRREAHDTSAHGGAERSPQSPDGDESSRVQDAPAPMHAALRIWMQPVDAGGAHVLQIRLDAVA